MFYKLGGDHPALRFTTAPYTTTNNENPLPPAPVARSNPSGSSGSWARDRRNEIELANLRRAGFPESVWINSQEPNFSRPLNAVATSSSSSSIPVSLPGRNPSAGHITFADPFADPNFLEQQRSRSLTGQSQTSSPSTTLAEQRTGTTIAPIFTGRTNSTGGQQSRFVEEPLTPATGPAAVTHQTGEPGLVEAAVQTRVDEHNRRFRIYMIRLSILLAVILAGLIVAMVYLIRAHERLVKENEAEDA